MENIKHQGLLTIDVLKEQVEKGLIEGDSILAIGINGGEVLVGSLDVGIGRFKGGYSRNIIVLHPKKEEELESDEEREEERQEREPSRGTWLGGNEGGIDHEKVEELNHQISSLLRHEPAKEIIISLAFCMSQVIYKCIPDSDDEFIMHIANLIRHALEFMRANND